ncbi:hypothetical protein [Pseudomonas protegens]|uniref:hypothetical protein n=1 Tax=Pseudomonas protegens TaxID=380021 RepID=UPI0011AF90F8|nr:hypothetical protein [Pseudomonas protegens]
MQNNQHDAADPQEGRVRKNTRAKFGSEIKSQAFVQNCNPAWILKKDGTVVLAERFVDQGAINHKSLTT